MERKEQINEIHEGLNDVFSDLHEIAVCDEAGREAKQRAFLSLIGVRKRLDGLGLNHTLPAGGA